MSFSEEQIKKLIKDAYEAGYYGNYDLIDDYVECKAIELEPFFRENDNSYQSMYYTTNFDDTLYDRVTVWNIDG